MTFGIVTLLRNCLKRVASGRQPGEHGAQEPEHTRQYVRIPSTARTRITHAQQLFRLFLRPAVLMVALPCLAAYAAEVAGIEFNLNILMTRLSQVPATQVRFHETKYIALLTEPLTLSGTLSYVRPDRIEKRVVSPYAETISVAGDTLTIENQDQGEVRTLTLSSHPLIWAFVESIRATLAGDLAALRRYYRVEFEGSAQGWLLSLYPHLPEMERYVAWIRINGFEDRIRGLEIQEANGDRSLMTVVADAT